MELTGKLSDFGLTDILQILALSKKTGTLTINNHAYEGQIVIEDGRITFAFMRPGESFATFLQQEGVLSEGRLQTMLEEITRNNQDWDFAGLLIDQGLVSAAELDDYVHRYLRKVISSLLRLERGHFGIVLGEIGLPGFFDEVKYHTGLGIEEVLLSDAHQFDEYTHKTGSLFYPGSEEEKNGHRAGFEQNGHWQTGNLEPGNRSTGSLDAALLSGTNPFTANATGDLHRSSSIVSASAISNGFPNPSEAVAADTYAVAARREYVKNISQENEDDERLHLWDETDPSAEDQHKANNSNILCSLLAELRSLSFEAEVSLSVMRYASEVATRGILFVVKDEELCGLGQFGVDRQTGGASVDEQVRSLRIPIKVQSIFTNVVKSGIPYVGPMSSGYWNLDVVSRLGEAVDELKAFVLPIFCLEKVMFVIYGDNYPGGKDFDGFEEFLVFVNQASVILENIVLERKLFFMQEV
jgi:hypothetical protein